MAADRNSTNALCANYLLRVGFSLLAREHECVAEFYVAPRQCRAYDFCTNVLCANLKLSVVTKDSNGVG